MATNSLRPQIVQVMAAHRERPFTTQEIYEQVAAAGVPDFDPTAKRDRNLVNRELSDLAGCSAGSHSKPAPQLLTRLGRGVYIFRELDRPMDLALVQEYLEPQEVYEKRPPRRRGVGSRRDHVPDSVRMGLYAVQHGICPGCGFYQPHFLRFEADHIIALADDGKTERAKSLTWRGLTTTTGNAAAARAATKGISKPPVASNNTRVGPRSTIGKPIPGRRYRRGAAPSSSQQAGLPRPVAPWRHQCLRISVRLPSVPPASVLTLPCMMRARFAQATVRVLLWGSAAIPAKRRSPTTQMLPVCRAPDRN